MHAKYIKREIPDLNGTGRTQACYKMELTPMTFQDFVNLCHREGGMDESQILGALSLVSEKLALCMAEGFSVKLDGIGTFNARLGVRDDMLQDAFLQELSILVAIHAVIFVLTAIGISTEDTFC